MNYLLYEIYYDTRRQRMEMVKHTQEYKEHLDWFMKQSAKAYMVLLD